MRIIEVDALKAIAIVGVVFAHIAFEGRLEPRTLAITQYIQLALGWCVIAFFMASGFLMQSQVKNISTVFSSLKKRFLRLILPCVVFSISYKLILWGLYLTGKFSWVSPAPSNLTEVIEFIFSPVGPQFYFLYYLFVVSCVFSLLNIFLAVNKIFLFSVVLFPIIYEFIDIPQGGYGPGYNLVPFYWFAYVAGHYISKSSANIRFYFYTLLTVSISFASFISSSYTPFYIIVPFFLMLAFTSMPKITKVIDNTMIGKFSSGIYVWHAPIVLPFVSIVCVKVIGGQPIVLLPIVVLTLIVSIVLSWITFKFNWLKLWRF
jgi:hypothetical protein